MILPRLKSSIPAGVLQVESLLETSSKKALYSWLDNLPHMDMEVYEAFYGKDNGIFCACANSVYQASPRGGGRGLGTRLSSAMMASHRTG